MTIDRIKENNEKINNLVQIFGYKYDGSVKAKNGHSNWICSPKAYRDILTLVEDATLDFIDELANIRVILKIDILTNNEELFVTELISHANAEWWESFPQFQILYCQDKHKKSWFWFRKHALYGVIIDGQLLANRVSSKVCDLCGDTISVEKIIDTINEENDSALDLSVLKDEIPDIIFFFENKGLISH